MFESLSMPKYVKCVCAVWENVMFGNEVTRCQTKRCLLGQDVVFCHDLRLIKKKKKTWYTTCKVESIFVKKFTIKKNEQLLWNMHEYSLPQYGHHLQGGTILPVVTHRHSPLPLPPHVVPKVKLNFSSRTEHGTQTPLAHVTEYLLWPKTGLFHALF